MSWQDERMDKPRLLGLMEQEYATLEAVLAVLDSPQVTQPGVYGDLSVKDVLAHIATWQRMEVGWLQTSLRGEPVVRYAPGYELSNDDGDAVTDRFNAQIFEENRDKPFATVLADLRTSHTDLLALVQTLSDDDLQSPQRFDWWDGEPIWTSIAGNSYEHVREHRELIESWLANGDQPTREEE
jgi:hypothetical protein